MRETDEPLTVFSIPSGRIENFLLMPEDVVSIHETPVKLGYTTLADVETAFENDLRRCNQIGTTQRICHIRWKKEPTPDEKQ